MTYLTLDLLVEKQPDGYRSHVLNSPAGQAQVKFVNPFTADELNNFLARVGLRGPIVGTGANKAEMVQDFGGRLFAAAFHDEVVTCYRRSLDAAERDSRGLRIRLRLNDVPELGDLPWEYLYDGSRQEFLGLSKETPIVRYLELPEPVKRMSVPAPINLLAILAGPTDYPELKTEEEWTNLQNALEPLTKNGKVTLTRLDPPTLDQLRSVLRRGTFHIVHFIGHGEFSKMTQQGALILENETHVGRPVSDERVATLFNDHTSLRLVVLNACDGGRTSAGNPFAGVAPRLVQRGIPAVMAMQFPILDTAAIQLSQEFYRTLADGYPVDAAMNEARRSIYLDGNSLEWGTPVLLMRAEDGMLFEGDKTMSDNKDTSGKPAQRGGINITGGNVSVGRDMVAGDKIVHGDEIDTGGGDFNSVNIGAGAQVGQVAAGRNITQASGGANEKNDLRQKLADLTAAVEAMRNQVDARSFKLGTYQLKDLEAELLRTEGTPSGANLIEAAQGLVESFPAIGGPLGAVLKTAAAQKALAAAGVSDLATKFG